MLKRACIVLALVLTVALPFGLRPKKSVLAKADDSVVIITSHNEATRSEFGRGFQTWYRERTGRTVVVDWRVVGGTSDITRYLEGVYHAAFERHWTAKAGRTWTAEIQAGYVNGKPPGDAPEVVRAARAEFLTSEVSSGIDLFFGGGSYDYVRQAQAGRIVPSRVRRTHPEWFRDEVIPRTFTGEQYWDDEGCWVGNVLSSYGILYNSDALKRLGLKPPAAWRDLGNPRFWGELALCDPTKSSSMAKAFENIVQQEIWRAVAERGETGAANEAEAVRRGWEVGLLTLQKISANARYFTDASQKPPIDVAQGDCAAGICIDFYGRAQAEAVAERGTTRLGFVTPQGGTVNSVDPIALLRGAPHREVAELFIEYTLTLDAQKLWNFRPGTAGGTERYALRRLPVRRDFYERSEWKELRSDPEASPFADPAPLVYRPEWSAHLIRELAFVVRVLCLESHAELKSAMRAIHALEGRDETRRAAAWAKLADLGAVDYAQVNGRIRRTLNGKNKVDEVRLATELGERFRRQYREAEQIARGGVR
jgi:ABC-type Fe3+ transport system substrate-binding protein